ncbi:MAG TPA: tRNA pseudouridine(55) synthase TruB [Actinomycetota bacterium]|nr:tRNA pseudouridine(55) synthase TruB [Actinomycetota bacterium]
MRTDTSQPPLAPQAAQSGLLLIDKPSGITSHDAVDRVRRVLGVRKVGHAGTLDPSATGLLLIGVGRATRLLRFLGDLPKTYEGTGVLGVETTTLDAEGEVVRESSVEVTESALREALAGFIGRLEQVPPAYSAVKVGGEKLYRAARAGRTVEAAPRSVEVFAFDLAGFISPRFEFAVRCSSGTYVRSLVADVGARLRCGAHLASLRRTAIGPFSVEEAVSPDEPRPLLPLERAVEHLPSLTLQEDEAKAAVHGQCLGPTGIAGPYRAIGPDGRLIGIYRDTGAKACPDVILAPPA